MSSQPSTLISQLLSFLSSRIATCTALAGLVFACRCWLIAEWGSPVPFWDQWGVEGSLYRAWLTDSLVWSDLFAAHNEHRIIITKVADIVLFVLCGSWNPWVQQLLNGALHAATAGLLAAVFWEEMSSPARVVFLSGAAFLFCSTAGWQNALWGFQSQVYFTSLFGVVAFAGLTTPVKFNNQVLLGTLDLGLRWWLALIALFLALVSNAGGLLVVIIAVWLAWPRPSTIRAWVAWSAIAATLACGLALRVSAPQHASLNAHAFAQFLEVFGRGMSWPHVNSPWAWLGMQLPLVWLCIRRWKSPTATPFTAPERCACALAAFATLQAAAVAYTRGAGLPEFRPLSRYQDPLLLGATAQLYAAARLAVEAGRPGRLILIGWSSLALLGLISLTTTQLSLNLPYKRSQDTESLGRIRLYLQTSDASAFTQGVSAGGPDSNSTEIKLLLSDPILRPVLPREFYNDIPRLWPIAHYRLLVWVTFLFFVAALTALSIAENRTRLGTTEA